jgi:glycosyltransferase involved in cell wall biosynthesis
LKLSIIVPIYKVEKYIIECIKSIVVQLKPEYEVEIICINDGTPDQSFCILKEYISKIEKNLASKFIFIEQENLGLSGARNTGINIANGEYIAFIDSDDKIYPEYLGKILNFIDNNDFDILDFNAITSNNQVIKTENIISNTDSLMSKFKMGNWFAWARIYKKELFNNERFLVGIYYEDIDLVPMLYLKSKKIMHVDSILYWYRCNPNGITQNQSLSSKEKTIKSLEIIFKKYNELNGLNMYIKYMDIHCYYLLVLYSVRLYGGCSSYNYLKKYKFSFNSEIYNLLSKDAKFFVKYPYLFIFFYSCYCYLKKLKLKFYL